MQILEEDSDDGEEKLIYTTPSDDGFDSDKSDDEHEENLNSLGRNMLLSKCELQTATQGCEEEVCEKSLIRNEVVDNEMVPVKRSRRKLSYNNGTSDLPSTSSGVTSDKNLCGNNTNNLQKESLEWTKSTTAAANMVID